jgi:hypothetical protein
MNFASTAAKAASDTHAIHLPPEVIAAIIGGAVSLIVLAFSTWVAGQKERDRRRRDTYSKAFAAVAAYKEFPYVVRRRRGGSAAVAAGERTRISSDLRTVQERLSYYTAWMTTESARVAATYRNLVSETRRVAGRQIHDAWIAKPVSSDAGMNMPDLGLADLAAAESTYLAAVSDHLSWRPWRRWRP